jgi:ribonuclease P protein component
MADDAPQGPPRVGFTATKKMGNAVARNRARRRLREAARRLVPLYGLPGVDYVFLARESTGEAPWQALLDDMKDALLRLAAALKA